MEPNWETKKGSKSELQGLRKIAPDCGKEHRKKDAWETARHVMGTMTRDKGF